VGGAVNVGGNVLADVDQAPPYNNWNMKAEWNVFADPFEAAYIFENTSIPVLMFPLDIADQTPVNGTFMDALTGTVNGDDGPVTDLDTLMYAMYNTIAAPQPFYRLWNTVTAAYMAPALQKYYEPATEMDIKIVTDFENQGWTAKKGRGGVEEGPFRKAQVFLNFKSEQDLDDWTQDVATYQVS